MTARLGSKLKQRKNAEKKSVCVLMEVVCLQLCLESCDGQQFGWRLTAIVKIHRGKAYVF